MDIIDFAFGQPQAVFDIFTACRFVPLDDQLPGTPFHQADVDDTLLDRLRRQNGPAGQIAFIFIKLIDLGDHGIELLQRDLLPDIFGRNRLYRVIVQDLRSINDYFFQNEQYFIRCFRLFAFFGFFHFTALLLPLLLDSSGDLLAFQIFPGTIELYPGVIITAGRSSRRSLCRRCQSYTGKSCHQRQPQCLFQIFPIHLLPPPFYFLKTYKLNKYPFKTIILEIFFRFVNFLFTSFFLKYHLY